MGAESVVGSGRKRHSSRHCGRKTFGSRALQTALTDARRQPNWFAQIATATDAGLLREMAVMQAFQMELARKNMELMDRLTVIAALDFLSRMEGTTGRDMDDLYARMVGAQQ